MSFIDLSSLDGITAEAERLGFKIGPARPDFFNQPLADRLCISDNGRVNVERFFISRLALAAADFGVGIWPADVEHLPGMEEDS